MKVPRRDQSFRRVGEAPDLRSSKHLLQIKQAYVDPFFTIGKRHHDILPAWLPCVFRIFWKAGRRLFTLASANPILIITREHRRYNFSDSTGDIALEETRPGRIWVSIPKLTIVRQFEPFCRPSCSRKELIPSPSCHDIESVGIQIQRQPVAGQGGGHVSCRTTCSCLFMTSSYSSSRLRIPRLFSSTFFCARSMLFHYDHAMLDDLAFHIAHLIHQRSDLVATDIHCRGRLPAGDIELRKCPSVPLTCGTTAQLAVHATAFMPLCADDETIGFMTPDWLISIRDQPCSCGDGHRTEKPVASAATCGPGIQRRCMRDADLQHLTQQLANLYGSRTYQRRPASGAQPFDLVDNGFIFFAVWS